MNRMRAGPNLAKPASPYFTLLGMVALETSIYG